MRTLLKKAFMEKRNKKGSHVDWAISMGIFLVYLIGLFILIRPGVTPVHKPEGLLEILEDKFNKEVMWEVREIPLFIKKCIVEGGVQLIQCEISIKDKNDPAQFTISNIICEKGGCLNKKHVTGDSIICDDTEDKPNLGDDSIFRLTYHLKDDADKNAKPKLTMEYHNQNENYCKSFLGASISKIGINENWLEKLKPVVGKEKEEYDELKTNWKFPKDFSIYYGNKEDNLIKLIGGEEPQGVNLFIKQFKTQYAKKSGGIEPVIINIRVW